MRPERPGRPDSFRVRSLGFLLILSPLWVLLDQLTKALVAARMALGSSFPVLGDAVRLTYIRNPHGAFSLQVGSSAAFLVLSFFAILLILLFYFQLKGRSNWNRFALALVLGGAVGNFIDRLLWGEVRDFIDVNIPDIHIGSYHLDRWPVFNLADAGVTVGVVMLLLGMVIWRKSITQSGCHAERSKASQTPLTGDS